MIYADNAATTRVSKAAVAAMLPFLNEDYGNPQSPNLMGERAFNALNDARNKIALLLGAEAEEMIFTSGGSEANNQALITAAKIGTEIGKRKIIISEIEHDSVYKTAFALKKHGFEIVTAGVDSQGIVNISEIENSIDENTFFVSVMTANNEIGTIQPIAEIGELCRKKGILFHSDAVQAAGHLHLDVKQLNVDMLSISAHKFGGVKGIGALYVRKGIKAEPIIIGGGQEMGLRAGTQAMPLIAAMAAALEDSLSHIDEKNKKTIYLRDRLTNSLLKIPNAVLNGHKTQRLGGNVNISFSGINSDTLLMMLDNAGICASKGAACHSGEETPSRVITALGRDREHAIGTIRFSLSHENTQEETDFIAETVKNSIYALKHRDC